MTGPSVRTHCPYCALQCGTELSVDGAGAVAVRPSDFPVNDGGLCQKGWTAPAVLRAPDRLRHPLVRDPTGTQVEVDWDTALDEVARRVRRLQDESGPQSVGVFGGGALTNEKAYLLGKFARLALRTDQFDYNGRFCMSSAAEAATSAFGIDRGLPFPVTDLRDADVDVASFGDAHARTEGALEVAYRDPGAGTYAKLVLDAAGEVLLGGVLAGDAAPYPALRAQLGQRLTTSPEALLA